MSPYVKPIFLIFVLVITGVVKGADTFAITIYREYSSSECTSGYLAVDGQVICYCLERPWQNNQPLVSAIPAGVYPAHVRYDHADAWRIELDNVPHREHVEIHVGNWVFNSEGCILVGASLKADDLCVVLDSKAAYSKLRNLFYGADTPNSMPDKDISVDVEDATH
jgi:hypothetical protein